MKKDASVARESGLVAPVERLILVDEVERLQAGRFQSQSLPGHLLHLVTAGAVSQWAEGRAEVFSEGAVVWYHENEPVQGEILRAPWRFITINFSAPALPPPPDENRVLQGDTRTLRLGKQLLTFWRNRSLTPLERQMCCHRTLLELLHRLLPRLSAGPPPQPGANLWWRIEKHLRLKIGDKHSLASIQRWSGCSVRTVIRACKAACGVPPMKRLKALRLGYAQGLVQHSDLPITEIAFRVGYERPQEFSRDYRRRFHACPREDRRGPPAYQKKEAPHCV